MKVAIYEPVHLDWIVPYVNLFLEEDIEVYFLTNKNFRDDLKKIRNFHNKNFKWYFVEDDINIFKHVRVLHLFFNSKIFDLIIINSIDANHLIISINIWLLKSRNLIINIHELNNFFNARYSNSIRNNIRTLGKKVLNQIANGFIVNDKAMLGYISENKLTTKPVFWLPPVYFIEENNQFIDNKNITVVVPGSIDKRRRDYELVLEAFEFLSNSNNRITIILAGKPIGCYGKKILNRVKSLQNKGFSIISFTNEIQEVEFQELIRKSTFIIAPLIIKSSIHDDIEEIYGLTKVSGNIYDAIRHGKPLMIPYKINVPNEIKSSCILYQSKEDFINQLDQLITNEKLLYDFIEKAKYNSSYFSKGFTLNRLRDLLDKNLN